MFFRNRMDTPWTRTRTLTRVTRILGFDDGWLADDSLSPYTMRRTRTWSLDAMPASLRPTVLQLAVDQHPWIDLFPCPRMRDSFLRMIQVHGENAVDEDELCRDYADTAGAKKGLEDGASAIVWSDPWSPHGWELTAGFVKKWPWFLQGCVELQAGMNAWRTRRGLERLRFLGC
ncbi:hypothetical protein EV126DRAFT_397421 [Verticillium dahliae]|nr:hypothetical protein EV126DRAFT_404770 [Verticillium dahliae]KAH6706739.1 hypothetical protein EV126DRAFT_397421 [Verticillium dahliae]